MRNESFNKVFIGSGLMAEIFLHALIRHKGDSPDDFYILGKNVERCKQLMNKYQIRATTNYNSFVSKAKVVVLAVDVTDTADIPDLVGKIRGKVAPDTLIASITPYLKIAQIEQYFPDHPVMRLAVNLSAISGTNVGTYCCGSVSPMDTSLLAKFLMESLGTLIEVKNEDEFEKLWRMIFAQSTISYIALSCMIESALKAGLTPEQSRRIPIEVFNSIAETFKQKYKDDLLRRTVEYKNVIQTGLNISKEYGLMDIISRALNMAPEKLQTNLARIHKMDAQAEEDKYEFHYIGW